MNNLTAPARRCVASRPPMSPIDYAVRTLRKAMEGLGYNPQICGEVCQSAYRNHSLVEAIGFGMVEAEDIDELTEALAGGFPDVADDSPLWGLDDDSWTTSPRPFPAIDEFPQPLSNWLRQAADRAVADPTYRPDVLEQEAAEVGIKL